MRGGEHDFVHSKNKKKFLGGRGHDSGRGMTPCFTVYGNSGNSIILVLDLIFVFMILLTKIKIIIVILDTLTNYPKYSNINPKKPESTWLDPLKSKQ
jgi:hypothetical protein